MQRLRSEVDTESQTYKMNYSWMSQAIARLQQELRKVLANVYWRLMRLHRVETRYWDNLGGSYNRTDKGIAEALLQTPDRQMRNFFRHYAQVEHSYALAAANQIKRERRDRKPLKVLVATAQNGFVSQNALEAEPAAQPVESRGLT